MEITICAAAGLVVAELSRPSDRRPGRAASPRHIGLPARGVGTLLTFAVLIMGAGLLLSASRGALIAIAASLLATITLSMWFRGRRAPEARLIPGLSQSWR